MKKMRLLVLVGMVLAVVCCLAWLAAPVEVQAKQELEDVEGASYNVDASLADNLKIFVGKKVYVTLDSGKSLGGTVKAVGAHLLHLEKLDGKEHFDALIPMDHIIAIDTRFRQLKR